VVVAEKLLNGRKQMNSRYKGMSSFDLQRYLQVGGFYGGAVDGVEGPMTQRAVRQYVDVMHGIDGEWSDHGHIVFSYERQRLAVNQHFFARNGWYRGRIDGLYGPATEYAIELWQNHLRGVDGDTKTEGRWPLYRDMIAFYGKPGENNVTRELPYPMRLAWDTNTTVNRIVVNKRCADSMMQCLKKVLDHYGYDEVRRLRLDLFGGCYNNRLMRGGTRLSVHAVAAAIDIDPEMNPLRAGGDKAWLARPQYDMWWRIWEEEGWVSLGRRRNYDYQHIQAVRL
jgi:peptidoglycan hydrolase-like protein with peptidoglycan-binding domain